MHEVDEDDSGEFDGPSRGAMRREALAVLELAHRLVEQPAARLTQMPLNDELLSIAVAAQRITAQIARKRQVGFLAKKLRREDEQSLDAIRAAVEHAKGDTRRDTAALHRIEALRDALLTEQADQALAELLDEYPHADRQRLRQLARNAREERQRNKPPHAFRELFRELRELMQSAAPDVD